MHSPEWKAALTDYLTMMTEYGPPGASSNGFNENLSLFQQGKCGMWIDATVAASFVTDPASSTVADKVGFAKFPNKDGVDNHGNWLWAWSLAIPASSDAPDAAKTFIAWATSKGYTDLVASKDGWRAAPPGTRTSLYANPDYQAAAPFAARLLEANFLEVDRGVVEAARSFGADNAQIIFRVMLPEALPAIVLNVSVLAVALIGYTAMAGVVGGGGLGDLAFRVGYSRFQDDVTLWCVLVLVLLVRAIQMVGNRLYKALR